jgi:hypothetical protein
MDLSIIWQTDRALSTFLQEGVTHAIRIGQAPEGRSSILQSLKNFGDFALDLRQLCLWLPDDLLQLRSAFVAALASCSSTGFSEAFAMAGDDSSQALNNHSPRGCGRGRWWFACYSGRTGGLPTFSDMAEISVESP